MFLTDICSEATRGSPAPGKQRRLLGKENVLLSVGIRNEQSTSNNKIHRDPIFCHSLSLEFCLTVTINSPSPRVPEFKASTDLSLSLRTVLYVPSYHRGVVRGPRSGPWVGVPCMCVILRVVSERGHARPWCWLRSCWPLRKLVVLGKEVQGRGMGEISRGQWEGHEATRNKRYNDDEAAMSPCRAAEHGSSEPDARAELGFSG